MDGSGVLARESRDKVKYCTYLAMRDVHALVRVKGYDHILDVRGVFVDELSDASRVFIRRADCELGV